MNSKERPFFTHLVSIVIGVSVGLAIVALFAFWTGILSFFEVIIVFLGIALFVVINGSAAMICESIENLNKTNQ